MEQGFMAQLEQWHQAENFQCIIDAIEAIPAARRGYELTGLLARAYENVGHKSVRETRETVPFEKALALLRATEQEGAEDPNWHFRMGYALYWLDREEEAMTYFRRVLRLIPDDPETQAFWADCREMLAACQAEVTRREIIASYTADPLDSHNALDYLLRVILHDSLETEDMVTGDHLYCPDWTLTLTPGIRQLTDNSAALDCYLYSPQWGKELYECSVGMGSDPWHALNMAGQSLRISLLSGIGRMARQEAHETLETAFAGQTHRWQVYLSNVVGIGEAPDLDSTAYWAALRAEIAKRLGNQRLCYVKVYGANSYGQITGECRIDDVKSEALSALVAEMVEKWEVRQFASHKVFFFLRQEADTLQPNAYWDREGLALLKAKVRTAAELFYACEDQAQYAALPERMAKVLGDATLAEECFSFLPEICAENAFDELAFSETIEIQLGDQPPVTCYKNQLADYWPLHDALFSLFEEGVFGEAANEIYQSYIGVSAIYNMVEQMRESEPQLADCQLTSLRFQVEPGFEIR